MAFRCGQVHKRLEASGSKGDLYDYETELLEQFADTDAAKEFFSCLDGQLNKVNQFYKTKEKEFLERGESLKKQMEILIEIKTILQQQQRGKGAPAEDSKEDASISCTISCGISYMSHCVYFNATEIRNKIPLLYYIVQH